ncbi:RHS repeat domain-containing protein [Flavobacterium poyangense]|uniref:RHS repeat domain-containing protein n=1 Tax=Flavobacterium poyangense TaxID=2204302 RepID=UPI00141E3C65|nr:RHS repeat domain-containing protein [Flavobacterium sp. JXAS1]
MLKNNAFVTFLIMLFVNHLSAQVTKDIPNYFPVSPNAASFAKQGLYPVDYYTGKLNISIPIYTIKTKELTVPLSLSYNTSGIQLNQTATWVGLGWNLDAGGAIVRNVKGIPDSGAPIVNLRDNFSFTKENYKSLYQMQNGEKDTAPDEYIISAPGLSGSFYFDPLNPTIILFRDFQNTKVTVIDQPYNGSNSLELRSFQVVKDDGTTYIFGESAPGGKATEQTYRHGNASLNCATVWYLTKIISANGKEEISFAYKTIDSIDYPVMTSESLRHEGPTPSIVADYPSGFSQIKKCFLQSISFANGRIDFISTLDRQDLVLDYKLNSIEIFSVTNGTNKLIQKSSFTYDYYSSGTVTDTSDPFWQDTRIQASKGTFLRLKELVNNNTNTKHTFVYNSTYLKPRGSTAQDYWGYMNTNTGSLIPPTTMDIPNGVPGTDYTINFGTGERKADENQMKAGILERINYPEGGYTIFEYEANRYIKDVTSTNTINKSFTVRADGTGGSCNVHYGEGIVTVGPNYIYGSGKISYYFSSAENENGPNSYVKFDNDVIYRLNYDPNLRQYPTSSGTIDNVNVSGLLLKAADFRSGVNGPSGCPFLNITASWKESAGTVVTPTTFLVGGLRIKSIKNYLNGTAQPVTEKQYTYEQGDVLNVEGLGIYKRKVLSSPSIIKAICSSSALYNNNIGSGPNIVYGKVTETDIATDPLNSSLKTDNGKIEYYYERTGPQREIDVMPTLFKHPSYNIFLSGTLFPYTTSISDFGYYKNDSWNYGSLLKTTFLKKDQSNTFKVVKNIDNTYQKLIEKTIFTNVIFNTVLPPYNAYEQGFVTEPYQGNDTYSAQFFYFTGGISLGKKVISSTIETDYDDNEQPTTKKTTTYGYENPAHYQVTKTEITNSKAQTLRTQLSYPQDLVATGQTVEMQKLIAQNKIDKPVKTETFVNNVQTSESITKYEENAATGGLLLPKEIHSSKGVVETFPFSDSNRKVNFDLYDTDTVNGTTTGNGNVLQYTVESGTPVSIIWGYNKTQPIAKIENATYDQVTSYVSNLQNISNTGTEADLITALNALRASLPAAMVTTYTYIPLVGISTLTDPKGNKITYTYDTAGRLEFVKDAEGNLVSQNQYRYKNQ